MPLRRKVDDYLVSGSDILDKFGKYQILQYLYASFPLLLLSMIHVNYIFVAGDVQYRCRIQQCDLSNTTYSVPWWPEHTDPCTKPILNETYKENGLCTNTSFKGTVEECTEWIYENYNTIIPKLNLACQPWKKNSIGSVHNIGMCIAMILGGWMSDSLGRKPAMIICGLGCFIGNFKTLATNYPLYLFLEFIEAVISGGVYTATAVLMLEIAGKNKRVLAGVLYSYAIYVGEALLALIAMVVPYWKTLIYIICSPALLFLFFFVLSNESPRWLILRGKTEQAKEILKAAARMNKLNIDEEYLNNMDKEKLEAMFNLEESIRKQSVTQSFKCREIVKRFLISSFCRFTVSFVYYGLLINSVVLPGDKYTNFALAAAMSFPGDLICLFLMNRIGRKLPLMIGFLLSGIACVASGYASKTWLKIFLFLVGKLVTSACYTGVITYSVELFPTSVRGSLIGLSTLFSSLGNILAPLTPALSPAVASIIFGCLAVIASGLLWLTPETKDSPLFDTIEQIVDSNKKETNNKNNNSEDHTDTISACDNQIMGKV